MTLGERMLRYRAVHKLTQKQLADLICEQAHVVFRCENNKNVMHKANELRVGLKMDELERKEREGLL